MNKKKLIGLIIFGWILALAVQTEGEGRILPVKITQERRKPDPRLNVTLFNEELVVDGEKLKEPAEFRIFTNYALFIDSWKLEILDGKTKKLMKIFEGGRVDLYKPILLDPIIDRSLTWPGDRNYIYRLTVSDKDGKWDRTREKKFKIQNAKFKMEKFKDRDLIEKRKKKTEWIEREGKINNLEVQSIPIKGEVVTIGGEGFEHKMEEGVISPQSQLEIISIKIKGEEKEFFLLTPLEAVKLEEFMQDIIVPEGEYEIIVASHPSVERGDHIDSEAIYTHTVKVRDNYLFFVALADGTIGYTKNKGNIEPVEQDDKFRKGFWSEGKLAYYLKGKIKGRYLITSSLDTERDNKELFRNLDPDKYYPVYGDASTIIYDANNTQGMLYLLIEVDKSSVLWGNYETGFTETELAQFSRTLYGGKLHFETVSTTKFGDPKTKLIVFGARAKQKAAHNEFLGTGGSLYYLKDRDIIEGSEKVTIEVRDKITGLVLERLEQKQDADYEIDYDNGRIIFWQPVSLVAESDSIISTHLLDGHPVYVVVDYEYEIKDKYDEGSYGLRASQTITDYLKLGSTYVKEEKEAKNYQLKGVDATLYLGKDTELVAEYSESESEEVNSFISTDGGLNFTQLSMAESAQGKAYGVKIDSEFIDNLGIIGYYKKIEDGFSTSSTISQQGKELIGAGFTYDISLQTRLSISHDIQKLLEGGNPQTALQVGAKKTETSTAQIIHEEDKLRLTGEYRHNQVKSRNSQYRSETNEEGETIAAKADYQLNPEVELSLEQQATVEGSPNHQTTAGITAKVFDWLDLKAEEMVGTRGNATSLGLESENNGVDSYGYYTITNSHIEGKKAAMVFGGRRKISENLDFTAEREHRNMKDETSNTNILGLSGDIGERVGMRASFERGLVQHHDGDEAKRNAGSVSLSYVDRDSEIERAKIQASTKLEMRLDEGDEDKRQYLTYNAVEWKTTENLTLFTKANLSQSENKTGDFIEAEYKELVTGLAYRPINFDRLNLLARHTYLSDDSSSGQSDFAGIDEEKAHIYALEGVYDLTDRLQLVEKYAYRIGKEKVTGFDFNKTRTWLWINRLNYQIADKWQIGGEYRLLTQKEAEDSKQGILIELMREIGEYIQVGGGYNWTDFNDDLTDLDYTCQGPFLRLTGKFYDRTPEEIERLKEIREEKKIKAWAKDLIRKELARSENEIMKELYNYYYLAQVAHKKGRLKEARKYYQRIIEIGRKMEEEAKEYVREQIAFEERIKEYSDLAKVSSQEGKLEEAKALWGRIIQEAKEER